MSPEGRNPFGGRGYRNNNKRAGEAATTPPRPPYDRMRSIRPMNKSNTDRAPQGHFIRPAWIDAMGRTRTWDLLTADGVKLAEICTRRDGEKLAALLDQFNAYPALLEK